MVEAIIFDMDGVLVNSEQFYHERRRVFLEKRNHAQFIAQDLTGSNEQEVWEKLIPDNVELREMLKIEYRDYRVKYPVPFAELIMPDVKALMLYLKKKEIKIAIASSSERSDIELMQKHAGIEHLIDFYISGSQCSSHKPSPEIYNRTIEELSLDRNKTIAIEDSPSGIKSAKNAGLKVLALKPQIESGLDQSDADIIVNNLLDIISYIET